MLPNSGKVLCVRRLNVLAFGRSGPTVQKWSGRVGGNVDYAKNVCLFWTHIQYNTEKSSLHIAQLLKKLESEHWISHDTAPFEPNR